MKIINYRISYEIGENQADGNISDQLLSPMVGGSCLTVEELSNLTQYVNKAHFH